MTPDPVPPARRDEGEFDRALDRACDAFYRTRKGGFMGGNIEEAMRQALRAALPVLESAAFARGRAEGIEEAANALQPWVDDPKGAGMRAGPGVPPSIRHWARYMQDAIRALLGGADRGTPK